MAEYVEREAVIKEQQRFLGYLDNDMLNRLEIAVKKLPLANVEKRETGEWEITEAFPHNVYCSVCHTKFAQAHWTMWKDGTLPRNYCPNCGARMVADG